MLEKVTKVKIATSANNNATIYRCTCPYVFTFAIRFTVMCSEQRSLRNANDSVRASRKAEVSRVDASTMHWVQVKTIGTTDHNNVPLVSVIVLVQHIDTSAVMQAI